MATTTAVVTLTSDLLSDNISVSASSTLMKAGTTADGLDMVDYGVIDIVSGDQFDLLDLQQKSLCFYLLHEKVCCLPLNQYH